MSIDIELLGVIPLLGSKRSPYACPLPSLSGLCPVYEAGYSIRPGSIPPCNRGFFYGGYDQYGFPAVF